MYCFGVFFGNLFHIYSVCNFLLSGHYESALNAYFIKMDDMKVTPISIIPSWLVAVYVINLSLLSDKT